MATDAADGSGLVAGGAGPPWPGPSLQWLGNGKALVDYEVMIDGVCNVRWNPRVKAITGVEVEADSADGSGRVDNFGDLLGPIIVGRLAEGLGPPDQTPSARLLSVGSIAHFSRSGDVVWGSGINGKIPLDRITAQHLDVRAVRGPVSQRLLRGLGHTVPDVFGDPALLLPTLFPESREWAKAKIFGLTIVPNLNDLDDFDLDDTEVVSPQQPVWDVIRRIAQSEFVIGSSLHAIIVAEAYGVPARALASTSENRLKYDDYYEGTARSGVVLAANRDHALALGPVQPGATDLMALATAFPADLWGT